MSEILLLDNYYRHPNGVIRQGHVEPFTYDAEYLKTYEAYPTEKMAHLRYEHLFDKIDTAFYETATILDVGFGDGAFLKHCVARGHKSYGFDVVKQLAPKGATTSTSIKTPVDIVTFFDVLEHRHNIDKTIEQLNCQYVVISAPCLCEPFNAKWFYYWKHRKPSEHIWHFSPETLVGFMRDHGYHLLDLGNPEDAIRKNRHGEWNIMTGIFEKQ